MSVDPRRLAVFDLDGTLTRSDTLLPYIGRFLARRPARLLRLLRILPPALCRYALGRADRGDLKAALIAGALGGSTGAQIEAHTARFVPRLLRSGLFAAARDTLAGHAARGDVLALMSASPDLYVPAIARALGFTEVDCTRLRWDDGRLTGALASPNCRGLEKARRLQGLRQRYPGLSVAAYGNSASDLAHLRLADRGVLVNGAGRARRLAAQLGVHCEAWR
ncbi:MAG: HAD-IB family hydrolase [Proteobacteria bacterium]|nr:HAD-IB family hydrolase [Pseudomonadota bacterium]